MTTAPKEARGLRTWVEIDMSALRKNVRALKRFLGKKTLLLGVVKSNAYGHGLVSIACALEDMDTDWLGVDSAVEAFRLRREGVSLPILVFGHTRKELLNEVARKNISLTISNIQALQEAFAAARKLKKPLKAHLKIDTGMHRQGFLQDDIPALKKILQQSQQNPRQKYSNILQNIGILRIEGIYSHLAAANPKMPESARAQMKVFDECAEKLASVLPRAPMLHIAASGGALCFGGNYDMARIGAALYGLWPSLEVKAAFDEAKSAAEKKVKLLPVLSWRTIVSEVKKIKKGEGVSYDLTEKVSCNSVVAICPIGYWHGYARALSGIGEMLVRGKRAKVLGRVTMDMCIIDVTGIKGVTPGDVVTLIGRDGKEEITAEELAVCADTIHYEIVTRINPLIKRIMK